MTRINTTTDNGLFKHSDLLDQHLFAAYREVTRVSSLARTLEPCECPHAYTLGTGHVKFFYDKGRFLQHQCESLYQECLRRGLWPNLTHKEYQLHSLSVLNYDWQPDKDAMSLNLIRLMERYRENPSIYTYNGKPAHPDHYKRILAKVIYS